MKYLKPIVLLSIFIVALAFAFVFLQIYFSMNDAQPTPVRSYDSKAGTLAVSNPDHVSVKAVSSMEKDIELLKFSLAADVVEDIELSGIAIEFYSTAYGTMFDNSEIRNLRLIDESGDIYDTAGKLSSSKPGWPRVTRGINYVWFNGVSIIPKGGRKTFTLLGDLSDNISLKEINTYISSMGISGEMFHDGIPSHFKARGKSTQKAPNIGGEDVSQNVYIRPVDSIGSLTIYSAPSLDTTYYRISNDVVLSKVYIQAGEKEDVEISKIGMRLTNFVPGQFKNVKLVQDNGVQYGLTVQNPSVVSSEHPNVIFFDKIILEAGHTLAMSLIGDVSIPSAQESEYGTQYQREVTMSLLLQGTSVAEWISAKGLTSNRDVLILGWAGSRLEFVEDKDLLPVFAESLFEQDTLSLVEMWDDPWLGTRFYPSDCVKNATLQEDLLNVAVKSIRGPDASAYSVEGFCQLEDGSTWINTSISILSDFWNLEGTLLLLDKNGYLVKDMSSTCVSNEMRYCKFLGMKSGNFFFQSGVGDGGGSNSRVFVTNDTGSNITLEETDDWLGGTTEPLSPFAPPCEMREATVDELWSVEFFNANKKYGHQKKFNVQKGKICKIANMEIIFFLTSTGEKGLAAIRHDDSKVEAEVMMIPEAMNFPQFIKLNHEQNDQLIHLAARSIDKGKHLFDVITFAIDSTVNSYPLLDYKSSYSIKVYPEECEKIRCIELPFER